MAYIYIHIYLMAYIYIYIYNIKERFNYFEYCACICCLRNPRYEAVVSIYNIILLSHVDYSNMEYICTKNYKRKSLRVFSAFICMNVQQENISTDLLQSNFPTSRVSYMLIYCSEIIL